MASVEGIHMKKHGKKACVFYAQATNWRDEQYLVGFQMGQGKVWIAVKGRKEFREMATSIVTLVGRAVEGFDHKAPERTDSHFCYLNLLDGQNAYMLGVYPGRFTGSVVFKQSKAGAMKVLKPDDKPAFRLVLPELKCLAAALNEALVPVIDQFAEHYVNFGVGSCQSEAWLIAPDLFVPKDQRTVLDGVGEVIQAKSPEADGVAAVWIRPVESILGAVQTKQVTLAKDDEQSLEKLQLRTAIHQMCMGHGFLSRMLEVNIQTNMGRE